MLLGSCHLCPLWSLASFSHRFDGGDKLVQLGEADQYEPLCRNCYNRTKAINNVQ